MALPNHCHRECPGAKRIRAHLDYLAKSDLFKSRAEQWRQENPERYQERLKNYFGRDDVKERMRSTTKAWSKTNRARKREYDKGYIAENRAFIRAYKAKYRAALRQAVPAWLTDEHWTQIRAVYAEAERLTQETGVRHDVDHIHPLQGKTVCGLHVPWNLRAIPRTENNRRRRVWIGEDDHAAR